MNTLKSLGRWALPLLGLFMILYGAVALFGLSVPAVIMGLIAIIVGMLLLIST